MVRPGACFFSSSPDPYYDAEQVYALAKQAVEAGCNDPLVLYPYARYAGNRNDPGLDEPPHRTQHDPVKNQDRGGQPRQAPDESIISPAPHRHHRQSCREQLQHGRGPYGRDHAGAPAATRFGQRATHGVEQPGAAESPVDADRGVQDADGKSRPCQRASRSRLHLGAE